MPARVPVIRFLAAVLVPTLIAACGPGSPERGQDARIPEPRWRGRGAIAWVDELSGLPPAEATVVLDQMLGDGTAGTTVVFWGSHRGGEQLRLLIDEHLRERGEELAPVLRGILVGEDPVARYRAMSFIAQYPDSFTDTAGITARLYWDALETRRDRTAMIAREALSAFGPPATPAVAARLLTHPDSSEAAEIIRGYGLGAIPSLEDFIASPDTSQAAGEAAATLIRELRASDGSLDAWRALFAREDGAERFALVLSEFRQNRDMRELSIQGRSAAEIREGLVALFDDPDPIRRRKAVGALGALGPDAAPALPHLIAIIERRRDPHLIWAALNTLSRMGPAAAPAAQAVRSLLDDPASEFNVRQRAAWTLGEIGPSARDAVPSLVPLLGEGDPARHDPESIWQLRVTAMIALARVSPLEAPPHIEPLLDDSGWRLRDGAADAIALCGAPGVPTLLSALRSDVPRRRVAAARGLLKLGRDWPPALAALAALDDDPEPFVRWAAADARRLREEHASVSQW
jgi:HEAT repeat protein